MSSNLFSPLRLLQRTGTLRFLLAFAPMCLPSVAVSAQSSVLAWGNNSLGQLGNGTTIGHSTPIPVSGLNNIVSVAAGGFHNLALKSDGTVWAWGYNFNGQLGGGAFSTVAPFTETSPQPVSGLTNIVAIAGGAYHSLALRSDGTVWAWGRNADGELGDGTKISRATPVQVTGLTGVVAIAAGGYINSQGQGGCHSLALKADGTVWAWGSDSSGQLGADYGPAALRPVPVMGPRGRGALSHIVAIAAGAWHNLALRADGTVWAWGDNGSGQLGDGTNRIGRAPVRVFGLSHVVSIATHGEHSLALSSDGTVWAWGDNGSGQLGDGTTSSRAYPLPVYGLSGVVSIACGYSRSLALRSDGTLWAWGNNYQGDLGNGIVPGIISDAQPTPMQVIGLKNVTTMAGGISHFVAVGTPL